MGSPARESAIAVRRNVPNPVLPFGVHSATLADGIFPGPIIAGTKVRFNSQEGCDDPSSDSLSYRVPSSQSTSLIS